MPSNTDLDLRLARLERTVGRQRAALLTLAGLAAVAGLTAAFVPQGVERFVQAREFILVDRAGGLRARLALTSTAEPHPFLELLDAAGDPFARLGAHPKRDTEPSLTLSHPGGAPALELLGGSSGPDLVLRGESGGASVWLSAADPAEPRVSLHEASGEGRVVLGVTEGSGFASFFREVEADDPDADPSVEMSFAIPPPR